MRPSSRYEADLRAQAVQTVLATGKTSARVAREMGIPQRTLSRWVREDKAKGSGPLPAALAATADTTFWPTTEAADTPVDSDDGTEAVLEPQSPERPLGDVNVHETASQKDILPMDRSTDEPVQEFLIPIHGFVKYTEREVQVIDHPAFQRLFRIHQMGQTDLVYRGATHRRGEHALGAVAAAKLLIEALQTRGTKEPEGQWRLGPLLSSDEITIARLSVLLHDIGHIAAGHTLEDELGILDVHDSRTRLHFIFSRSTWGWKCSSDKGRPFSETLGERIDRLFHSEATSAKVFKRNTGDGGEQQLTASQLLVEIIAKKEKTSPTTDVQTDPTLVEKNPGFRLNILRDLVGNTVCADLIDYIHRDWHNIGKPRFLDTRLLQYMEIRTLTPDAAKTRPNERESQIVVNLQPRERGRYRSDAVTAILDLLESRYQLWEVGILHRTKTSATAMLERALAELMHGLGFFDDTQQQSKIRSALTDAILEVSDTEVYAFLAQGEWFQSIPGYEEIEIPEISEHLLWRLQYRMLYKEVARIDHGSYSPRVSKLLASSKDDTIGTIDAARHRLASLRLLEQDFELRPGSLAMYCVPYRLGQKLAKVRVLHNNDVNHLNDADSDGTISGGHLKAQLNRFERLWRASLFAEPDIAKELADRDLLLALQRAFKIGVLDVPSPDDSMGEIAKLLLATNVHLVPTRESDCGTIDESELSQDLRAITYALPDKFSREPAVAMKDTDIGLKYPSGRPTLRAFYS